MRPSWVQDSIFYQIFPDRFARSSRQKLKAVQPWSQSPTFHAFKGGDLWGVIDHFDHLLNLGVNALYFTPVFSSAANHRYHTHDYHQIDPILGGEGAFQVLVHTAKRSKVRIVLDGVFNHASRSFLPFAHTLENGPESPYLDWFHFNRDWLHRGQAIDAYAAAKHTGPTSAERYGYQAWWDLPALPKFNTSCKAVREFILEVAEHWVKRGIDGWRLDVPNEIDDDQFWQEFRDRVRSIHEDAYICGEIWGDASRWLSQKTLFDGVMNYLFTKACLGFVGNQRLDPESLSFHGYKDVRPLSGIEFAERLQQNLTMYPRDAVYSQLNLLGSHDTPRLRNVLSGNIDSAKMAFLCMFSYPGAPCIYYGDEIGMAGGADPDCRRGFEWDTTVWDHSLLGFVRSLCQLRQKSPELRRGDWRLLHADHNTVAWERSFNGRSAIVAMNNSFDQTGKFPFALPERPYIPTRPNAVQLQSPTGFELAPHSGILVPS